MSKIEFRNVSKTFSTNAQAIHAVKDVSLHVNEKDIFGVIGFSGAGKSTLIRCINLLERPEKGEVLIDGKNLLSMSERALRQERKQIGMIFQHFNLLKARTVAQNVAFPLLGSSMKRVDIDKKVHELLKLVGLEDKDCAYPSQLSGGQKQRVAIARALASNPSVLLCDEATSALDPQTTQSILELLKDLNKKLDLTIVVITHEMAVVKAICNRVAIMEHGTVVEEGSIIDIFTKPTNDVTKKFINTTTSIHQIYDLIEKHDPLVTLLPDEKLLRLTYSSTATKEAVMANLIRRFDVDFNIIFGNVEVVANTPIGSLVIKLSCEKQKVNVAIQYLKDQHIIVEELSEQ